ncbi:unnamed protein product [Eruca vesicaria subsp. sativa]|uniref:F-box domain-containing protein n=1 Tax=Eruca vesicaria subsp. sativa TaxID=29727 RepID=A0ABC8JQU3_ERUVS|nr:unnamed protein product [Eruca vesicaria subsp. sativa]
MSPSTFSSLPNDIAWQVLARVPKRLYPLLACVSKNFSLLVRSPEIHKTRSLLRKDSLYICFMDITNRPQTPNWFTLRRTENNPSENDEFVSIDLLFPDHDESNASLIAHGPEIFFICGLHVYSSTLWIFDSRSGEFRQGPSMNVARLYKSVGLVGSKIYVVGGNMDGDLQAESFDLKTQTWEPAPSLEEEMNWLSAATVSLDRKVCALMLVGAYTVCYDTRDGSCTEFKLMIDEWWKTGACVVDNVLYVYYGRFGLMWYDTEMTVWRVVIGLEHLKKVRSVGLAEYYGKLAVLWKEHSGGATKEIWCRMIGLCRCKDGISGNAESSPQLLGSVPRHFRMHRVLSVSD